MRFSKILFGLLSFLTFTSGIYLRKDEDSEISRDLHKLVYHKGYLGYWGYWIVEKGYYKHGKFYCTKNCETDKPSIKVKHNKISKQTENPSDQPTFKPTLKQIKTTEKSNDFSTKIFPWILKWEGKTYVNDPKDAGGPTKYGITYVNNKVSLNAIGINSGPEIEHLTLDQAEEIYRSKYWNPTAATLSYPMNWVYFNSAVNNGSGNAKKFYEKSNGDYKMFINFQEQFYNDIVKNNPSQNIFLKGWLNRLNNLNLCIDSSTYSASVCK